MKPDKAKFYPNTIVFDEDNKSKLFGYTMKPDCDHRGIMLVRIFNKKRRDKVIEILKSMKSIPDLELKFVEYSDILKQFDEKKNKQFCEVTDLVTGEFVPMKLTPHKLE